MSVAGVPRQRRFRRGWLLDIVYWFFTALITKPIAKIGVAIVLLPLLLISGAGSFENMLKGHGPTGPAVADCTGGADGHSHRFYRLLVASRIPRGKTLVVSRDSSQLGGTRALPLFTAYAIFLDANVSWNFGPLRFVLASPRFHRWHHTAAEEGREKTSPGSCRYGIFFSAPTTCRRNSRLGSACRIRTQRIYSVKFSGRSEIQQGRKFSTDLDGENFAQSYAETPKSGG